MVVSMNSIAPRGHSPLGMSVLERRFACPGSMRMEEGRPDPGSPYARRGTDLHEVAARALSVPGRNAEDLIPDDPDGIEIIQPYLDAVRAAHARLGGELLVEHTFTITGLHELFWGTADAVIVAPPVLFVADLKTGAGYPVPIRRPDGRVNFQLGGYAMGALQSLPKGIPIERVEVCIIQPSRDAFLFTEIDGDDILDLAADLKDIGRAATAPDAPLSAGEHCKFCRASGVCPELRKTALADARSDFGEPPDPKDLTLEEIGDLLERADKVDLWVAALRNHAKGLADGGTAIPGWKLVNKRGRRAWKDDEEAGEMLAQTRLPFEDRVTVKVVSPAQAEKALKRARLALPATWNDQVVMTDPGTALVPAADKRTAIAARPASLDFEPEKTEEP